LTAGDPAKRRSTAWPRNPDTPVITTVAAAGTAATASWSPRVGPGSPEIFTPIDWPHERSPSTSGSLRGVRSHPDAPVPPVGRARPLGDRPPGRPLGGAGGRQRTGRPRRRPGPPVRGGGGGRAAGPGRDRRVAAQPGAGPPRAGRVGRPGAGHAQARPREAGGEPPGRASRPERRRPRRDAEPLR